MTRLFVAALVLLLSLCYQANAATWIVDESGSGNFTSLYAVKASMVNPGDIVYLRGTFKRTYQAATLSGTEKQPITITSYPGTTAVIDGSNITMDSNLGLLRLDRCNHVIVDHVLVRNSAGAGITLYHSDNILVKNSVVHTIFTRGIGGCGDNVVIQNNTVYDTVRHNIARNWTTGGWKQAVACDACNSKATTNVKNWVFEHNRIHSSYGEGVDCIQVTGCIVRHNEIYDTYSVNIYMDNAHDILVDSNHVYSTNPHFYRYNQPATGILVGSEIWPAVPQPTYNVVIQNNLLVGTNGIATFHQGDNYVTKVTIVYNTIWNPNNTATPFRWPPQPITPSGNVLKNNLIWAQDDRSCDINSQISSWDMSHNVWVGVDSVPRNCAGTGSKAVNASLIRFVSGVINGANAPLVDFLLGSESAARGAALPLSSVPRDYYGYPRDAKRPSAGFVEYGTDPNYNGGNDSSSSASTRTNSFGSLLLAIWRN